MSIKIQKSILIVCNDSTFDSEYKIFLAKSGIEVHFVYCIRDAKCNIDLQYYDLVCVSYTYDGEKETGIDLAKCVRRRGKNTKILFFSSWKFADIFIKLKLEGIIDGYLEKGSGRNYFLWKVKEMLNL